MQDATEFPTLPEWLQQAFAGAVPARLRRFGSDPSDLQFAFHADANPLLLANLLSQCSRTKQGACVPAEAILALPVGFQLEALLTLADLSGSQPFAWHIRCQNPVCRADSEFDVTAQELCACMAESRHIETTEIEIAQHRIVLRRPTGLDQLECLRDDRLDELAILRRIVMRPALQELLESGLVLDAIEAAVNAAMDQFDPLPAFHMQVVCPECGGINTAAPSLFLGVLDHLVATQEQLVDVVHTLASCYHWTEEEILRIPEWRRQGYLERIESARVLA